MKAEQRRTYISGRSLRRARNEPCANSGPSLGETAARRTYVRLLRCPQPSGEACDERSREAALRQGAAAGCRPLMRSNRPVRRRRQEAVRAARREIAVQPHGAAANGTHLRAICGPSPPKAAARRSLRRRIRPLGDSGRSRQPESSLIRTLASPKILRLGKSQINLHLLSAYLYLCSIFPL